MRRTCHSCSAQHAFSSRHQAIPDAQAEAIKVCQARVHLARAIELRGNFSQGFGGDADLKRLLDATRLPAVYTQLLSVNRCLNFACLN